MTNEKARQLIKEECDRLADFLIEKNRKYGNSALEPKRVFSKASTLEQINVRIDDKISRIMSAQTDDTEDAEADLLGYLMLKRVAKALNRGLEDAFLEDQKYLQEAFGLHSIVKGEK